MAILALCRGRDALRLDQGEIRNIARNPPRGGFRRFVQGFSLIELVVTMLIIGIMAVAILPRWRGNSGFDERAFRDRVVAGLRYAQKSAIATRRTTCATFSAAPASVSFRVSTNNGAANCAVGAALVGHDANPLVVTAPNGVSFAALPADIVFDGGGRAGSAATISITGLNATLAITVEAETGYVY